MNTVVTEIRGVCAWFVLLLTTIAFCASLLPTETTAQGAGLRLKPAVIEERAEPGSVYDYIITVENLNPEDETFFVFARNIKGVQGGGVPIFAEENERTGFELADWITLPFDRIDIGAGETANIPISIRVPDNASPGGHFGGVFFSVEPPEIEQSGAVVGYQVANIINFRIAGDVIEQANIRQFSTDKFLYGSQDVSFNVRIENQGNTLISPYGPLEVYNALGKEVASVVFNESQASIFPGDTRAFTAEWLGDGVGFGRYEAVLSPVYGEEGAKKTMTSTVTFWILPMNIIGPALGILGLVLLTTFIIVRLYIRRTLAHMQVSGRRINRRRRKGGSATMLIVTSLLIVTALFMLVLLVLFA